MEAVRVETWWTREAELASSVRLGRLCFVAVKFLSWNFLQIPMLQAQIMNRDGKENDIQKKATVLDEIKNFAMLNTADKASVRMMKIIM